VTKTELTMIFYLYFFPCR